MGSRIEIELTSERGDGVWTWRAAGAREPKGVVDAALLYDGVKVGDVVRAEADFEVDGITLSAVMAPKERKRPEPDRVEMIGSGREAPLVTSTLVGKGARGRPPKRPRRDAARGERTADRPGSRNGRVADKQRRERGARDGSPRPGRGQRAEAKGREERGRRFSPPSVRRAAFLESLAPEQRAVAEQLFRGGLPAVRRALEQQNASTRASGGTEVRGEPLLAMAEELLPKVKEAEWLDRAEAASKMLDEISLRDLRSVVVASDVARDDASRLLAGTLREALERRVAARRDEWAKGILAALDEERVLRALNQSAKPPDASSRLTAEMAARLREAAGAALAPDTPPDRWVALLEAVAASPVRRVVKPAGLPAGATPEVLEAARRLSGQVPALAGLLGIKVPPPPGPLRRPRPGPPRTAGERTGVPAATQTAGTQTAGEQGDVPAGAQTDVPAG